MKKIKSSSVKTRQSQKRNARKKSHEQHVRNQQRALASHQNLRDQALRRMLAVPSGKSDVREKYEAMLYEQHMGYKRITREDFLKNIGSDANKLANVQMIEMMEQGKCSYWLKPDGSVTLTGEPVIPETQPILASGNESAPLPDAVALENGAILVTTKKE